MAAYYLAGPMRGYESFNFPAFLEAAELMRKTGLTIISPAEHDLEIYPDWDPASNSLEGMSLEDSIRWDNEVICDSGTIGIIMLPGWEKSSGACLERAIAKALNKKIYSYYPDDRRAQGYLLRQQFDDETPQVVTPVEVDLNDNLLTGERTVVNEETGGAKGQKLARFDLVPSGPLWGLAELYGRGAAKYAERNWEKGYDWSLSYAAAQRHLNKFWQGENLDPEMGVPHPLCAVFHCFALVEFLTTHPELDDRPNS